ncbi:methyltransferase domain-containing protein [Acidovorax sp.]|uniref:methyltransferase domain-containing protein n=1 Tax=Acidovorax sp. TaxID=1872122 RepID=UPI00261C0891|nr:methyltransferase domain-containing protein [Acidovorax sp.]
MTHSIEDLHVYLRSITPGERTSLSVLASLVHDQATVLDLGCGSGALGQYLSETRGCTMDGVTLSEAEAAHARPHYRHVVVDNLESCDLLTTFAGQRYDFIVCADVLEHLSRPERVLGACRQLLQPEGKLLISVPNAGYSGLIAELLEGEFLYREEGLLDRTHLRFFTRKSLARFLGEQRWVPDSIDTITRELPESEFDVAFDRLPPSVARHLLGVQDALTYQFICVAHPTAETVPAAMPSSSTGGPAHALFTTQLYLGHNGHYDESRKLTASGVIGRERQTLRFELPSTEAPVTQLRLDPADRPGFVHLYRLALRTAQGNLLWQWAADSDSRSLLATTPHSQIVWQAPLPAASGATLLLLAGDEPWFELPIDPAVLAQYPSEGTTLEVELGWPMSADYVALSGTVLPLHDRIAQLESNCRDTVGRLNSVQTDLAATQNRNQLLEEANQAASRQRATWQQEATRLKSDLDELAQHLHTIETSTVFRATRPIVHAKMRLDRLLGRGPKATQPAPASTPITPPQHPVDIIVPVYRGLADTRLCVESVLASTNQSAWRLIVINDASPEPEVTQWLRERASQDGRITLLENPENLGFVGTVNRGMALSGSNDVLLLNSDTEVANDWLDRIRRAAYGDSKVASVTPFSNNATICSYPRFCKDNQLPDGYDTARLDALCAQTNPGAVVDVPTGVGFCMYIRRDCLTQVGLFDTENFGKGYGEENDFCQRAAEAGWRNLHLLDTFVLHTGGVSFGDSKSPRERAAMETLRRLHPRYERDVMAFVQTDPAQPYRLALDVARILRAQLPVVLAVLHDRAGGTLRHVRELAHHLSAQAVFLTLTPAPGRCVRLTLANDGEGFQLLFRLADQYQDLVQALSQLGVRHIHYHHLLGHDPLILDLPPQLDVGYDFTAHDFYSYCTHISVTGSDNRYAGEHAPGQCACCSPQDPAPMGSGTVADWRHRNRHFLTGARLVLAPSQDTAQRMAAFAPGARVRTIPHTDSAITAPPALPEPQAKRLSEDTTLKIVVLGALSAIKGADLLEAVALEAAKRKAPLEFHLLGYGYRHLQTQPRAHLTVHGAYDEKDLPGLLQWLQPHLVWFPAQWPETYSYTLSASLQAGLPVVAPDLGAFPERLAGRPWSWVVRWDKSPVEYLNLLLMLREQNFAKGLSPQPPQQTGNTPPSDWDYRQNYLVGLPPAAKVAPASMQFLLEHLVVPTDRPHNTTKSLLLSGVVRLRSNPLLRGVAQHIPGHWQRTIKNWLQT